ncbi:hypothetical protein [Streptomyces sp. NPDC021212]|uniref:hypothetical protein n=1 Tax=Streptomyces sp. NPDC021212 TaxID=3365118 RepID=UPI0037AF8319
MTTFRQLGQTLGVAVFGVLFRQAAGPSAGLDRVLVAAAATGVAAAGLTYALASRPAAEDGTAAGVAGRLKSGSSRER